MTVRCYRTSTHGLVGGQLLVQPFAVAVCRVFLVGLGRPNGEICHPYVAKYL